MMSTRSFLFALSLFSLACQSEPAQAPMSTPSTELPIVALTRDISVTMTSVKTTPDGLSLTLRIVDLERGRSRQGYDQPMSDEIDLRGLEWAHRDVSHSSTLNAVYTQAGGVSQTQVEAWDLDLIVRVTNAVSDSVTVSLTRLRPVAAAVQSGVPNAFDGPWIFTFVPGAVQGTPVMP